jgi:hypothetical protein
LHTIVSLIHPCWKNFYYKFVVDLFQKLFISVDKFEVFEGKYDVN